MPASQMLLRKCYCDNTGRTHPLSLFISRDRRHSIEKRILFFFYKRMQLKVDMMRHPERTHSMQREHILCRENTVECKISDHELGIWRENYIERTHSMEPPLPVTTQPPLERTHSMEPPLHVTTQPPYCEHLGSLPPASLLVGV